MKSQMLIIACRHTTTLGIGFHLKTQRLLKTKDFQTTDHIQENNQVVITNVTLEPLDLLPNLSQTPTIVAMMKI